MGNMLSSNRKLQDVERKQAQAWWGLAGLILAVAYAGIAFVLSGPVGESTAHLIPGVPADTWRIVVGLAIFVALGAISGMVFALFAPKRKEKFSERELERERKAIQYEAEMKKERQKQVRKQIAKARREGK